MSDARPTTLSGKQAASDAGDDADDDLNTASMLLVVGSVAAIFTAVAMVAFPLSIARLFALVVASVTIITLIVIGVLQWLGVMNRDVLSAKATRVQEREGAGQSETLPSLDSKANKPLPKRVDFIEELEIIQDSFDGQFPAAANEFLRDYRAFRAQPARRSSLAGTLRSALNPLQALTEDGSDAADAVEDIGDRLFSYINQDPVDQLEVVDYWFSRNGSGATLADVAGTDAKIHIELYNHGEPLKASLKTVFGDENMQTVHRTVQYPLDKLSVEEERVVSFWVAVPEDVGESRVTVDSATIKR